MGIIINGKVYNSNNITIINGQVVNGEGEEDNKSFDETRVINGNIKNITLSSRSADVRFFVAKDNNITVHLKGKRSKTSLEPRLVIKENKDEVNISVEFPNKIFNKYIGSMALEVMLPEKEFNDINIITQSSDISFEYMIKCATLKATTISGDINLYAVCDRLDLGTTSGDIDVVLEAKNNTTTNLRSVSGDINLELNNVSSLSLYSNTLSGYIRNRFREKDNGYLVKGNIITTSGDIKIH